MSGEQGHTLDIDSVTHRYGPVTAVADVSLAVRAGEIVALLGPSGCGKTTLLRVVAGFVRQSAGSVRIDGKAIDHLPANLRNVGIVFQSYALFPHMTVAHNVAYGLQARGVPRGDVRRAVERFLEVVRLTDFRDRLPRQLSGGQQQRVAVARALAVAPTVMLLDEPFSALDKGLRLDMQIEIKRLQRQFGLTAILVTHDQDEAMSVADRIAVMNHGRVEQFDTPIAVYDRPATLFVSGFIGTTNLLRGRALESANGTTLVELEAGAKLTVPTDRAFAAGAAVMLSARPEQLRLPAEAAAGRRSAGHRTTRARQGLRHRGDVSRNVGGGLPRARGPRAQERPRRGSGDDAAVRGRPDRQGAGGARRAAVRRLRARSRPPRHRHRSRALREIRGPAAQERRPAARGHGRRLGRHRGGPGRRHRLQPQEAAETEELDRSAEGPLGLAPRDDGLPDHVRPRADHQDAQEVRRLGNEREAVFGGA